MFEVMIAVIVVSVVVTGSILLINPVEKQKEARDKKRISDLNYIDVAINEYLLDNGQLPDLANTLRVSTEIPLGGSNLSSSTSGWILSNLSAYISKLPIDPVNDATYYYSYYQDGRTYELSAYFEALFDVSANDGGNDNTSYEIGSNLSLISP